MAKQYDQNMVSKINDNENLVWFEVNDKDFDLYGTDKGENDVFTCRIPEEYAKDVNGGVYSMRSFAAGVRARFSTNSPLISIRAKYGDGKIPTCCTACAAYGFDLYICNDDGTEAFRHMYRPPADFDCKTLNNDPYVAKDEGVVCYTLNFPYFAEVKKLEIGISKDCTIGRGKKYVNEKPVIYYGSSITHGAAASTPGYTYENLITQKYNINYVNLGFAGNAKGETTMCDYIAKRDMSIFVLDYDHNAPNVKHLEETHYAFYERFRLANPDIPVVMISRPDFIQNYDISVIRRDIIKNSYNKAVANGDKNVYFIDGETLMNEKDGTRCTIEGCHPNDVGFTRMADVIGKVVNDIMNTIL